MITTARTCRYSPGQAVEVLHRNFAKPGHPQEWTTGYVEWTELQNADRGIWHVHVRTGARRWSQQLVGPRGGNKEIHAHEGDQLVPDDAAGLSGNQCAARAYQAFFLDTGTVHAKQSDALYWAAIGGRVDPDQAARWATLRATYSAPCDPSAPEAAPARDGAGGLDLTPWSTR